MGTILFHFHTSARKANNRKHVSGAGFEGLIDTYVTLKLKAWCRSAGVALLILARVFCL